MEKIIFMPKTPKQLINNIIGQLNGISRMLDEGQDCLDILVQLKAAKSAMDSLSSKLIAGDVLKCSAKMSNKKDAEKIKLLLEELTKK
jgi:DNA-binding FrmR family transcriptional regulator